MSKEQQQLEAGMAALEAQRALFAGCRSFPGIRPMQEWKSMKSSVASSAQCRSSSKTISGEPPGAAIRLRAYAAAWKPRLRICRPSSLMPRMCGL